ncbi:uncharacterized protein BP5553_02851 [Venustampulla echinocandica]|uniref:FAD-binding domain-containing protein n=1 Tax=Venustampulla echinocandica TaxID=2656787 RepID=A0A370TSL0_9HELO|nr:uncharacterized protein BP5553_02851 [Venustampulla echinocandica]RDL38511.1 hypothetical protein BP5553_02851 [Venustampulla echinocandica]
MPNSPDSLGSSPKPLEVIIVGGGPCALATAISVTLAGHKATIFEAAEKAHSFGAGLQSSPNGTQLFSRWGLYDILKPVATAPTLLHIHSLDGRPLARRESYEDEVLRRYGSPLWTFQRVDLQAGLHRRAIELGVNINYSSRVIEFASSRPGIELENGERHHGDLVVVADGTWSTLRSKVLGEPINPQPTGDMAYRIDIDRAQIQDKELLKLMSLQQIRLWVGPGSFAVGYPVGGGTKFSVLLLLPDNFQTGNSSASAIIEEMRKRLKDWDPISMSLTAMLDVVRRVNKWRLVHGELFIRGNYSSEEISLTNDISTVPPPPTLLASQTMCVLAGDCGHSIPPFLEQSLNLGLEDAATLGCLLSHVTSLTQLPRATALYDRLRTSRARELLEETEIHEGELRMANGKLQMRRDNEMAESLNKDNDWMYPKIQEWIWSYDAYEEAEKAYLNEPY